MSQQITTAMIMAAGLGTRMQPLSLTQPKALIPLAGRPLIDHMMARLFGAGITKLVVNCHAFADQVVAHLAQSDLAKRFHCVISDERDLLRETGGGLKKARALLGETPLLVANIDSVWFSFEEEKGSPDLTLARLISAFDPSKMQGLQLLSHRETAIGYDGKGDFFKDKKNCLSFRSAHETAPYVQAGVHIIDPALVYEWPEEVFSLKKPWVNFAKQGLMYGHLLQGQWMHVGDPEALRLTENYLANRALAHQRSSS